MMNMDRYRRWSNFYVALFVVMLASYAGFIVFRESYALWTFICSIVVMLACYAPSERARKASLRDPGGYE